MGLLGRKKSALGMVGWRDAHLRSPMGILPPKESMVHTHRCESDAEGSRDRK